MSQHLWGTVYYLKPAETSPGAGIFQDYFGFYNEDHHATTEEAKRLHGTDAEKLVEQNERKRLNEGKIFAGYIARCQVGHIHLLVAKHSVHGLCAYVDERTSHADNMIQILSADTRTKLMSTRNDFFDNLGQEKLAEKDIESVCRAYKRVHVQLDRS